MNYPYLSCLKTYWAEIWNLSWLPPNILLAPILVLLRPSLILFFSMFLCLMLFLTPERAPKAGPATCIHSFLWVLLCCNIFYTPKAAREGPWRSASHHLYILCLIPTLIHKLFSFSNLIWLLLLNCCTIDALFLQSHLLKQLYSSFLTHPSPLEVLHHPGPAYRIRKNGQILMFKVSNQFYWSPWHDRIN